MSKEENIQVLLSQKKKFLWKFIISIILNVLLLIIPIYYSKIIDSLSSLSFHKTYLFVLIFAFLTIFYRLCDYFNQKAYFWLYLSLYKKYMNLGLTKTFNNSLYSLSRFSLSEYSNIMSEDFEMISDYYSTLVIRIVEIFEFLYIIIYFFFINTIIGLMTIFSSMIILFLLFYYNKKISKTNIERKKKNDKRISLFQEIFLSIKTIKGFNIIKKINERLNRNVDDYIIWHTKLNLDRYGIREVSLAIIDIVKIMALIIGIRLIILGEMTLGTITIIYSYYAKLSDLFAAIIVLSESLNNKEVSECRVNKLFQYASNHLVDKNNYNDVLGDISFQEVLYGNKMSPLLNEVSFNISSNSLTVLTGNTKACEGVFDLLLRYNRMHSGRITIDHIDFNEYSNDNISHNIGFVMEDVHFFNISIKDNLMLFDNNFENIISVCKYLNIDKDIEMFEEGYERILENNASNISNDFKYLLAMARVLIKKSKIILINNIFEHVSSTVYHQILKMLIDLKDEHTIILISRDLNLIKNKNVDKVIFFNKGTVLAEGKHQELLKKSQEYTDMIKKM